MKKGFLLFTLAFAFAASATCPSRPVTYYQTRAEADRACNYDPIKVSYDVIKKVWVCVCWNDNNDLQVEDTAGLDY